MRPIVRSFAKKYKSGAIVRLFARKYKPRIVRSFAEKYKAGSGIPRCGYMRER